MGEDGATRIGRRRNRERWSANRLRPPLCAGHLPLVWLAWWFADGVGRDDYDQGRGPPTGIFCVLPGPPLLA
ncbi:Putative integral membrane protein [Streptomyces ambofaciens ATCC 23877]|uniref:Putative integral membrane protein n=1 Tax=Streptomyces ambofaciens (strain ATCC 23877 / 3486 / DSM 40053 / JCM 4204 / NBRC 12836 / NRRL B-2516) TaxID=278992 RepID=A0A0K2AW96_STRA7|nr:Putative integral membrane protein [Streptomyces ambofaciens ATCC 23877]